MYRIKKEVEEYMQKKLNIAIVGLGNLGGELVRQMRVCEENDANFPLRLVGASAKTFKKHLPLTYSSFTDDYREVVGAENVDVVVEAVGGVSTAYDVVSSALMAGKHVVSANAPLMATQGERLMRQALGSGVQLKMEGAVHGNSGWVRHLLHSSKRNQPQRIYGVLGSSSNYVLMRMRELGETGEQALKAAREFSMNDKDFDYGLSGQDALYRSTILRGLAYGVWAQKKEMVSTGIERIEPIDIQLATALGYQIKLISVASADGVDIRPYLISENTFFGATNGKMMALAMDSDAHGSSFSACEDLGVKTAVSGMLEDLLSLADGGNVKRGTVSTSSIMQEKPQGRQAKSILPFPVAETYFIRTTAENWKKVRLPFSYDVLNHQAVGAWVGVILSTTSSEQSLKSVFENEQISILKVWLS